jgi:hypothetical protein
MKEEREINRGSGEVKKSATLFFFLQESSSLGGDW